MKKALLSLLVLISAALTVNAQSFGGYSDRMPRLSAGFGVGVTTGPQSGSFPTGTSLGLKFEYPIASSPVSITASAAYNIFISKNGYYFGYNSYNGSYINGSIASFVPVMVGARVYAGKLFFEGDAGASFNINSIHANYTGKNVALALSPSVGYGFRFGSSQKFGLDMSVAYETRLESSRINNFIDDNGNYVGSNNYGSYNLVAFHLAFSMGL